MVGHIEHGRLEMALDTGERMAIGVFCRNSERPLFAERFRRKISDRPPAALPWNQKILLLRNNWKKLTTLQDCCGRPGEQGC